MNKRALVPNARKVKGINVSLDDPIDPPKEHRFLCENALLDLGARFSVPDGL